MNRMAMAARTGDAALPLCMASMLNGVEIELHAFGALYLPSSRMLVVSDLHLEKGAAFARRGQLLPPWDTLATLKILASVIEFFNPAGVVSLGDNFHDRDGSRLMPQTFRDTICQLASGRDWIWINGNHDPDGVCDLPGQSADIFALGNLVFRHEPSSGPNPGEIAGHLHPAATVRRQEKSVRRPCFASDGTRMVMPSFGVMTGGLDLGNKAFKTLFNREHLVAHLLGRDRVYPVRYGNLRG